MTHTARRALGLAAVCAALTPFGAAAASAQTAPIVVTVDVDCTPTPLGNPGTVAATFTPTGSGLSPVATLNDVPPLSVPASGRTITADLTPTGGYTYTVFARGPVGDDVTDDVIASDTVDDACGTANVRAVTGVAPDQVTTPPTVFCPGCGPSGGTAVPGSALAWSYPEHTCTPTTLRGVLTNASNFWVQYGTTAGYPNPVQFSATIDDPATPGTPPIATAALDLVQPGSGAHISGVLVRVFPLQTIRLRVSAVDSVTGLPVTFGNGSVGTKTDDLTCDCPPLPNTPTTPSPTSPPTTPTTPGASTPGPSTPTTAAPATSAPGTTVRPLLPATGADSEDAARIAVTLLLAGAVIVVAAAFRRQDWTP